VPLGLWFLLSAEPDIHLLSETPKERFTALLHHLNVGLLRDSFYALQRKASPGVDGVTWQEYESGLEDRLIDLHSRVHRGACCSGVVNGTVRVRRERRLAHSGCKSHPGTGSFHPVAIGAAVGGNKAAEASDVRGS
jgi:hypothetical protein